MDLNRLAPFLLQLSRTRLAPWREPLVRAVAVRLGTGVHGDLPRWLDALARLPELPPGAPVLDRACVGTRGAMPDADRLAALRAALMALHPWRKGPFCLHGLHLDTEWRSDWKWDRLAPAIAPLDGRLVLDVGCGNGYHLWRMLGAGARLALGIDPTLLYGVQFQAIDRYLARDELSVLPLALEDLPPDLTGFDTVFSMGVLYHRRDPRAHLTALRRLLHPGGELVLETLVVEGMQPLSPPGRYAGMRNVWTIPTPSLLEGWLAASGFADIRPVSLVRTTTEEQRATDWMRFQSLADHLDPEDPERTREGWPAPRRAILLARRPRS